MIQTAECKGKTKTRVHIIFLRLYGVIILRNNVGII